MADKYPRIAALGVTVHPKPIAHVKRDELKDAMGDQWDRFCKFFGIQTQTTDGPYAHDVEAVLERMASGKLTGSQLDWD